MAIIKTGFVILKRYDSSWSISQSQQLYGFHCLFYSDGVALNVEDVQVLPIYFILDPTLYHGNQLVKNTSLDHPPKLNTKPLLIQHLK